MVLTGKASHLPVRLISSVEISKHKLCKSLVIIHSVWCVYMGEEEEEEEGGAKGWTTHIWEACKKVNFKLLFGSLYTGLEWFYLHATGPRSLTVWCGFQHPTALYTVAELMCVEFVPFFFDELNEENQTFSNSCHISLKSNCVSLLWFPKSLGDQKQKPLTYPQPDPLIRLAGIKVMTCERGDECVLGRKGALVPCATRSTSNLKIVFLACENPAYRAFGYGHILRHIRTYDFFILTRHNWPPPPPTLLPSEDMKPEMCQAGVNLPTPCPLSSDNVECYSEPWHLTDSSQLIRLLELLVWSTLPCGTLTLLLGNSFRRSVWTGMVLQPVIGCWLSESHVILLTFLHDCCKTNSFSVRPRKWTSMKRPEEVQCTSPLDSLDWTGLVCAWQLQWLHGVE